MEIGVIYGDIILQDYKAHLDLQQKMANYFFHEICSLKNECFGALCTGFKSGAVFFLLLFFFFLSFFLFFFFSFFFFLILMFSHLARGFMVRLVKVDRSIAEGRPPIVQSLNQIIRDKTYYLHIIDNVDTSFLLERARNCMQRQRFLIGIQGLHIGLTLLLLLFFFYF